MFLAFSPLSILERVKEEGEKNGIICRTRGPLGFPNLVRIVTVQLLPPLARLHSENMNMEEKVKGK